MIRYTWGMHQYLRRLWRRRPRPEISVRIDARPAAAGFDRVRRSIDPTAPLPYVPEPVDQDAPGWGPRRRQYR